MTIQSEYARMGVDYRGMAEFKEDMAYVRRVTAGFALCDHNVYVSEDGDPEYLGHPAPIRWRQFPEGLGTKNFAADWMDEHEPDRPQSRYHGIAIDTVRMATTDANARGYRPVTYADHIAAPNSAWFQNQRRNKGIVSGFCEACREDGVALVGGESAALPLLGMRTAGFSGTVLGFIPYGQRPITGRKLAAGDVIIGAPSSGPHANGSTLLLNRAATLPDNLLTALPNGHSLGEDFLVPTRSYVRLGEALLDMGVDVHAFQPVTGGGVGKIAVNPSPFTYRIHSWPVVPVIFQYMREIGVTLLDCLTTFNWGVGFCILVAGSPNEIDRVLAIGRNTGHVLTVIGRVEEGERKVIFEPEGGIEIPPPGL